MIPKIIWQTYKTVTPPSQALSSIRSWLDKNPDYEWIYFDDAKCNNFIKDNFSSQFYDMYQSLPFGVMRADVWRVAIVYVYGGIYTDLDTVCLQSASQWIDRGDLIVSVETPHGSIANFSFAAIPKHPALHTVLKTFLEIYSSTNFLNRIEKTPTPVQNFGAHAFSYGLLNHYNLSDKESMELGAEIYNTNLKVKEENAIFFPYHDHRFAPNPTSNTYIHHQTASVFWKDGYESWREQQLEMLGV
jgi:inositol phosphorylceramide mannosyltransferase catalytic subunit